MNKIGIKSVGAGKQITFEDESKSTFTFYYEAGSKTVDVWELHPKFNFLTVQKYQLELKWLSATIRHTIASVENGRNIGMPTPLGEIFVFSRNDFVQLRDFLKSMEVKNEQ